MDQHLLFHILPMNNVTGEGKIHFCTA